MGRMVFKTGVCPGEMSVSQKEYEDNFHSALGYKMYEIDIGARFVCDGKLFVKTGDCEAMPFEGGETVNISRLKTVFINE